MTDSPQTLSAARRLARKVVPLPVRRVFVTVVERVTRWTWKPGRHHVERAS